MMNVMTKLSNSWRDRSDHGKTIKFAEVAQIREFCEFRDAREKCTAFAIKGLTCCDVTATDQMIMSVIAPRNIAFIVCVVWICVYPAVRRIG